MAKPKVIAFYLPQYHPIKENNEWFGEGFTEWTNVGNAKPLFKGHYQPRVPADLGYYDLRLEEVREKQVTLAKEAGVYGFCYWHYWFGNGKRLLNRIWDEVIDSGKPDFPLCLGWANHSWFAKRWDNRKQDRLLVEQLYPGIEDYKNHFFLALKAFNDNRYIKIKGKPVFIVFDALAVPKKFFEVWNNLAKENGFPDGICFIGRILHNKDLDNAFQLGYEYVTVERVYGIFDNMSATKIRLFKLKNILLGRNKNCVDYKLAYKSFNDPTVDSDKRIIPMIIPNWDHSPRSKGRNIILHNSTPGLFAKHVRHVLNIIKKKNLEDQIIFLKSWNEWGEGNYMEPDLKWGKEYIEVLNHSINNPEENE